MKPGESWAYRARGIDPLVEVRIVREGTSRPARVLVRFVNDEFEGREEWVPPARLKVLWSGVEEFGAREQRWSRVSAVGLDQNNPRSEAAVELFNEYVDSELAMIHYNKGAAMTITEPEVLAEQLNLRVEQLTDYPETFFEDGAVVVPWTATEAAARAVAEQNAERILHWIRDEERKAQRHAIHGYPDPRNGAIDGHISAEISAQTDRDYSAPIREVLRSWCGIENVERFDELIELRKEIKRVDDIAQSAIDALAANGQTALASQLQHELDTPVEMLRVN